MTFRNIINLNSVRGNLCCPVFLSLLLASSLPMAAQTYEECVDSADYYIKKKNWDNAEKLTIQALRIEPANKSNWLLWSNLGEIRTQAQNEEGAIQAYTIGLTQNPQSKKMLTNRAALLLNKGENDLALDDLNAVLSVDSLLEWPLMMKGMLLLGKNDIVNAENTFKILNEHYPTNAQGYNGLARIEALRGNADKATSLFAKAIEIDPDETTWFYKITVLIENDKLQQAGNDIREAMKRYPRSGDLFLLRAWIHKLRFQNDEAEIDRKLALEYGADPAMVENIFKNNDTNRHK